MDSYNKEVVFHLPGLFRLTKIYEMLLNGYKNHPETFKDNVKIGSIYGSPTVIWNGGRLIVNCLYPKEQLELIRDFVEHYQVPARFTFTNCLLEEKHLHDTYGNLVLDIYNTGNNEIICNSEILENYIREKYGDRYKYISSTTKRLTDKNDQTKEVEKDYHLIVLDYDYNKDFEYLQSIENKDKCELLCNPICVAKCPHRVKHYQDISKRQLEFDDTDGIPPCSVVKTDTLWMSMKQANFISVEDINNIYSPMGFSNFKLEGRTAHPLDLIEVLLYYLIKDEYKAEIRSYLQSTIW
jgi:hypothetical protein